MDPASSSTARRFRMHVGLGKKKAQRQPSLRRNPSQRVAEGSVRAAPAKDVERGTERGGADTARAGAAPDAEAARMESAGTDVNSRPHPPAARPSQSSDKARQQTAMKFSMDTAQSARQSVPADVNAQRTLKPQRSKGLLGMLSSKLRSHTPSPEPNAIPRSGTPPAPPPKPAGRSAATVQRRGTRSAPSQGPPLDNSFTSKARREEALRARGLLPPARIRYLSELEAEQDARLNAVVEPPPSESGPSRAKEIAEMWRKGKLDHLEEEEEPAASPKEPPSSAPADVPASSKTDVEASVLPEEPMSALQTPFSPTSFSDFHTPPTSPMVNLESDSAAQTSAAPATPPKSPRSHPIGPRKSPPSSRRSSHSRGASFDRQFSPLSEVTRSATPTKGVDTAEVTQSRSETATPTPSSLRTATASTPRKPRTLDSVPSPNTPGRKSTSSQRSTRIPSSPTSLRMPPSSPRSIHHSSPRTRPAALPAPSGPLPPTPSEVQKSPAPTQRSFSRPSHLHDTSDEPSAPSSSDHTTSTMPTSPTLPSLMESTSSHMSHTTSSSSVLTPSHSDSSAGSGGPKLAARAPITPIIIESTEEGIPRTDILIEQHDALLRVDGEFGLLKDAHAHALPSVTLPLPTARPRPPRPEADERRKSLAFFGGKKRAQTLGAEPQPPLAKPLSLTNLRRSVAGALRPRPVSQLAVRRTPSPSLVPPVPASAWKADADGGAGMLGPGDARRRPAAAPRMHSRASIVVETRGIEDDESRRLSELAFLD
ncbi:hypothetical protein DENSPDRAFT_926811 [Dentipellis sp. KUC8613]|nr:hypothetical protein DENSPDRAFT_926811 [Dentipellis sp. KUC8613]